jgi:hypothetical protein
MPTVPSADALLDSIAVDFSGDLAIELRPILVDVFGKGHAENDAAQELGSRKASQLTKLLIDTMHSALPVDFDNARTDMLIACSQPGTEGGRVPLGRILDVHVLHPISSSLTSSPCTRAAQGNRRLFAPSICFIISGGTKGFLAICGRLQRCGLGKTEGLMNRLDLPKDVQERVERRWAQKLKQQVMASQETRGNQLGGSSATTPPPMRPGKRSRRSQPQAA